jgi:hypothetical protein
MAFSGYPRGPRVGIGLVRLVCVFATQHACAIGLSVYEVAAEKLCQRLEIGDAESRSALRGRLNSAQTPE